MILCDWIHRDPGTMKPFLMGCFSVLASKTFPVTHPVMAVYVQLTDGRGTTPVRLRLIDAEEERDPLFEQMFEIEFTDPRAIADLQFLLPGIVFTDPGEYRLQLFAGTEPLMERRLAVLPLKEEDTK